MDEEISGKDVVLRISSSKDEGYTKKVAGAISWRLRETGSCRLRAIRTDAVNSAIKALAIVNKRTEEIGLAFEVDPTFDAVVEEHARANAIEMEALESPTLPTEFAEYKISGKDDSNDSCCKLAGSIALSLRSGRAVAMRCIGPMAVYKALYAATLAKGYSYSYGYRTHFVPTWFSMKSDQMEDGYVSVIQILCWGTKWTS